MRRASCNRSLSDVSSSAIRIRARELVTTNKDSDKHKYKYYGQIRKGFNTFDDIYLTRIITRQFHAISLDNEI